MPSTTMLFKELYVTFTNIFDRKPQLVNDPNGWCAEHDNPRYILDLMLSVISVSLKTLDLIDELPKIEFQEE